MLGPGQLGSSCPVNWQQSSFVGLHVGLLISINDYQVHIDDYMFNKDVLLMIIAQTTSSSHVTNLNDIQAAKTANGQKNACLITNV